MKIQFKRSNQLDGTDPKAPLAEQLEYGEIAVNYNADDSVIFLKDSNNAVIRIAGSGKINEFSGNYSDLENKPLVVSSVSPSSPAANDLWLDFGACPPELKVWSDCEDSGNFQWLAIGGAADPITLEVAITDDGANLTNNILTASASNIQGGIEPQIYNYQWKANGLTDGQPSGIDASQKTIINSDSGKVITCEITCAEPDGNNAVTISARYADTPSNPTIDKPQIISPASDAGLPDNAPEADEVVFISSVPSGDNVDGKFDKSYWHVSETSDFSSPSITEINIQENITQSYQPSNLDKDTQYWIRVKYDAFDSDVVSNFSDTVTFKTAAPTAAGGASGSLYYDAANERAITGAEIIAKFGVSPSNDLSYLDIYELTEQATFTVEAYLPFGNKYAPVRNYSLEAYNVNEQAALASSRIEAAEQTIETHRVDFEARITALENP